MEIVCWLLSLYMLVLVARAVLSWFPIDPRSPVAGIAAVLDGLTEPVLAPLRSVIPPAGMFDLSFLVLLIGLMVVRAAIC